MQTVSFMVSCINKLRMEMRQPPVSACPLLWTRWEKLKEIKLKILAFLFRECAQGAPTSCMYPTNKLIKLEIYLVLFSCFASNSLIDQQVAQSGFCGSWYGTRPRVLVFAGSGYDDRMDSERTPNSPRMGKGDKGGNSC